MHETAVTSNTRPPSRIEGDIEQVKALANQVNKLTGNVVMIARSLGYFEPPKAAIDQAPTPVVTNMADAIRELERAVNNLDGSMNLFI